MMALLPVAYSIANPLIGGFIYTKRSLKVVDFFQPTTDKKFTYETGMSIAKSLNMALQPGTLCRTNI
jgi:hypothetical protein